MIGWKIIKVLRKMLRIILNQTIDFLALPLCDDVYYACPKCPRERNIARFIPTQQGVSLPVITCDGCGYLMRDKESVTWQIPNGSPR